MTEFQAVLHRHGLLRLAVEDEVARERLLGDSRTFIDNFWCFVAFWGVFEKTLSNSKRTCAADRKLVK